MISLMSRLLYHRNIFGSSSVVFENLRNSSDIFGNFRKFSENVRNNFGKSSESGQKSSENRKKRGRQYVYNKKNITRWLEDMNFMFSWQEQYPSRLLCSLMRYCSRHSNIKFISPRLCVISSKYVP